VWAVLAVAAAGYFVVGGVLSLIDGNWLQAAFRLAAAAFLGSWLVRHHGTSIGGPLRGRSTADPDRPDSP